LDKVIARTTPCLLGLLSVVTLLAALLDRRGRVRVSTSAWYHKKRPTFAELRPPIGPGDTSERLLQEADA
jgi:hypothetical protein